MDGATKRGALQWTVFGLRIGSKRKVGRAADSGGGEAGDRVQGRRLRGDVGSRGVGGGLTDAATAMEIMGYILAGKTSDSKGAAGTTAGRVELGVDGDSQGCELFLF